VSPLRHFGGVPRLSLEIYATGIASYFSRAAQFFYRATPGLCVCFKVSVPIVIRPISRPVDIAVRQ